MLSKEEALQQHRALAAMAERDMEHDANYSAMCDLKAARDEAQKTARAASHGPMPLKTPPLNYSSSMKVVGDGAYFSSEKTNRYDQDSDVVASKLTGHGDGFWSEIRIYDNDYIRFQLHRGSRFKKLLFWMGLSDGPKDSEGQRAAWDSIGTHQLDPGYKLESNLGKTYLLIDEMIAGEMKDEEHRKFIRGIADTDPENLKMIAGLKKLDEGMTAPLSPTTAGTSPPITSATTTVNKVTGKQPGASAWAAGASEIIRVGNIRFGDKMQEAIKSKAP